MNTLTPGSRITVLIVDDSPLARRALRHAFESDPEFTVVGEAVNGREAIARVAELKPRLVTIDVMMPEMDGIEAIEYIMAQTPTRILVITSEPHLDGRDLSFEALQRGALDLLTKPTIWPALDDAAAMLAVAKRLAMLPVVPHVRARQLGRQHERQTRAAALDSKIDCELLALGASTGGPRTLQAILAALPGALPVPVVIVQHLSDAFVEGFVQWLGAQTPLRVREAVADAKLVPRTVYVSARGPHIVVAPNGILRVDQSPPRNTQRPSIDMLFDSVAEVYGQRAIGVLLSGMGADGAQGLLAMANAGAVTVAQDESTSAVFGMPKAAIDLGAARHVLARDDIAPTIVRWLAHKSPTRR